MNSIPSEISFNFQSKAAQFKLNKDEKREWVIEIIESENKQLGNLSYVFCTDAFLIKINKKYLQHNNYTDIISFNYVEDDVISGEIYISVERVRENASSLCLPFQTEMDRVIAHGVLHLLGYNDQTTVQKEQMRSREDYCLTLRP